MSKHWKKKQYVTCSLNAGRGTRIVHQIWSDKTTKKCFNHPNKAKMLCFDKLTGEHNKKHLKFFIFWEYILKLKLLNKGQFSLLNLERIIRDLQWNTEHCSKQYNLPDFIKMKSL